MGMGQEVGLIDRLVRVSRSHSCLFMRSTHRPHTFNFPNIIRQEIHCYTMDMLPRFHLQLSPSLVIHLIFLALLQRNIKLKNQLR